MTITIKGLTFTYGNNLLFCAMDATFEPGVTWLQGANGCGKSTLFKILGGEIRNYRGSVQIGGYESNRDIVAYREKVHLCAGEVPLFPWLRVSEFFDLMLSVYRSTDRGALEQSIDRFGLRQLCAQKVDSLSLGQYKKMQLAIALALNTTALLLDEPFNGLDKQSIPILQERIANAAKQGRTVIVISHTEPGIQIDNILNLSSADEKLAA